MQDTPKHQARWSFSSAPLLECVLILANVEGSILYPSIILSERLFEK